MCCERKAPHREPSYLITTFKRIVNRSIRQFPVSFCHSQHPRTTHTQCECSLQLVGLPPRLSVFLLLCVGAAFYRLPYVVTEAVFIFRVAGPPPPSCALILGQFTATFSQFSTFVFICRHVFKMLLIYVVSHTHTHTHIPCTHTHACVSRHASSGNTGLYGK